MPVVSLVVIGFGPIWYYFPKGIHAYFTKNAHFAYVKAFMTGPRTVYGIHRCTRYTPYKFVIWRICVTYFGFLARFLVIPLVIMGGLFLYEKNRGTRLPAVFQTWSAAAVIIAHVIVAVVYTTPWDNYLVATKVWWYDPNLVTGYVIGWVPIEEYTFFVLQTILTGMWTVWLMTKVKIPAAAAFRARNIIRWLGTGTVVLVWLASTIVLIFGPVSANYLTLILSWALIPVIVQFVFGADILWHYGRLILWGLVPSSLYLGAADALAINAGTWTISPEQTVGIKIGGILPLEEFIFFVMTNLLVVFGVTLVMAIQSHERVSTLPTFIQKLLPASKATDVAAKSMR